MPQEGISCRPNDGSHRAFGLHQRQRVLGRLLGLFLLPLDNLTCRRLAETSDVESRADCRDAVSRVADHFAQFKKVVARLCETDLQTARLVPEIELRML